MSPEARNPPPKNRLLLALGADDYELLQAHLTPVLLPLRHCLEAPKKPIREVFFLQSGMASNVALAGADRIEVGVYGREGMSGIPVILGTDSSPQETFIQVAGEGLRMASEELRQAMRRSPSLQKTLLAYVHCQMTQTSHTAFANGHGKVEERLARWLLMVHDRMDGDVIPLVHEFLALMLGVRRAGVTEALHALDRNGAIQARRGRIIVADRERLEQSASGLYGVPEAEYRRLFG
ncbi:MAG TPA: Crp/Fnr family transcriptional regulator [Afifellaceae bacterium]|nr:Crp/Fnr family transcriptional regulator [Afifellaceae bacterium]